MNKRTSKPKQKDKQRPYASPQLVSYGNLRRLTMGRGGVNKDGAIKPSTKVVSVG